MKKIGAILLVAWGGFHAYGAVQLPREATDPSLVPGWPFLGTLAFAALLTAIGGIALWANRNWALAVSIGGVAALWGAPVAFVIQRFGWSGLDASHHAAKFAASVAVLVLPIAARLRNHRR